MADSEAPASAGQDAILAKIETLATTYSASALPDLAPFLVHEDPAIRDAARNGVVLLGRIEGAVLLRQAADKIKDPREAVRLLDAADYLEIPPAEPVGGTYHARPKNQGKAERGHFSPKRAPSKPAPTTAP